MELCPYCEKYGVIDCVRRSRPEMKHYSKKRLLEVIDDLLNHHKGGLRINKKDEKD